MRWRKCARASPPKPGTTAAAGRCLRRRSPAARGRQRVFALELPRRRFLATDRTPFTPLPPYITPPPAAAKSPSRRCSRARTQGRCRRPPTCISTTRYWRRSGRRASTWPGRPLTCCVGAAPFSRCGSTISPNHHMHQERFVIPLPTRSDMAAAAPVAGASSPSAQPRCAPQIRSAIRRWLKIQRRPGEYFQLPFPHGRRPADHQLPPAEIDAADAVSAFAGMIPSAPPTAMPWPTLPLLQLRRRHGPRWKNHEVRTCSPTDGALAAAA